MAVEFGQVPKLGGSKQADVVLPWDSGGWQDNERSYCC